MVEINRSPIMWQSVLGSIEERVSYLLTSNEFSDIDLVVGPSDYRRTFPAHKLILAMSSSVFAAMFYGALAHRENRVKIPDTDPDAFQIFLCFIYTDQLDLQDTDRAILVYWLADKYMVNKLKNLCCKYLSDNINSENVCQIYEFAKLGNCSSLVFRACKFIVLNTESVIGTKSFETININTLKWITNRGWLNVALESTLFAASVAWAKAECSRRELRITPENQRTVLEPVISDFRFRSMTSTEFIHTVVPTGVLTQQESLILLEYLVEPKSVLLPDYFNTRRKIRNQPMSDNSPESACILTCEGGVGPIPSEARVLSTFTVTGDSIYIVGIEFYLSRKNFSVTKCKPFDPIHQLSVNTLLTIVNRSTGRIYAKHSTNSPSDQYGNVRVDFEEPSYLNSGETCQIILDLERSDSPLLWCNGRHTSQKEFQDDVTFSFQQSEYNSPHSHIHKIFFWTID